MKKAFRITKSTLLLFCFSIIGTLFLSCEKEETPNEAPTCEITSPTNGDEFEVGETINILVEAGDSDGSIEEVKFYINGTEKGTVSKFPFSYSWNTSNEDTGDYDLKATSYDNESSNSSNEISIKLVAGSSGELPIAKFSATPTSGTAPLNVDFTDQSENNPTNWQWDFGDGNTSNQQNPSHTYNNDNSYTVSLTIGNNDGNDTETKTNYILVESAGEAPIAEFTATPTSGTAPLSINFTDQSENNPAIWQWDFGDGNSSNQQNPSHTYNNGGSYTVSLTVSNNDGNDTETKTNYILVESIGEAPIAKFIATPTSGTVPLPVNFTDQSENNPTNWQWDFGDGNSSNQQNPIHTYNIGGSYTVSLTVHNNHGNDTKTDHIIVEEAVVGIPCPGIPTITYEGQTYNTVQIESQCWLKENLNVGTSINGNQNMENNTTIEKYCLNNDVSNCDTYGGLYQWDEMMHYSTIEGFQGICPDDWHIPTDDEWKTMEMALGMTQSDADNVGYRGTNQGEQMKSTTGWNGTNTSRFTALPGSHRNVDGSFSYIGSQGGWWSSSESTNGYVGIDARLLSSEYNGVYRYSAHSGIGYSVRCVKNF